MTAAERVARLLAPTTREFVLHADPYVELSPFVKVKSEGYAMRLRLAMSLKVAITLVIIGFLLLMLVAFELIEAQFTSVCPKSDARCAPSYHHAHGAIQADHS